MHYPRANLPLADLEHSAEEERKQRGIIPFTHPLPHPKTHSLHTGSYLPYRSSSILPLWLSSVLLLSPDNTLTVWALLPEY